ncbi:MAG: 50S ribosomal protein L15 [Planctomycetaceae bacterium]|nr:50S ribosomal protein L15 [Planctomycetaceae bacterium]
MNLDEVNQGITGNRPRKRLGRGPGTGQGKTGGRGHKGQRSRPGRGQSVVFQGGTMPLFRRIPKRGFTNSFADVVAAVNVRDLDREYAAGEEVTIQSLQEKNLAKRTFDQLKILGTGELTKALKVTAHQFSESAKAKIEQAGGTVVVIPGPAPVVKNKQRGPKKR